MTFWKLVRAIACGILLAELVNGLVYGLIIGFDQARHQRRLAEENSGVVDQYKTALESVRGSTATIDEAAERYCTQTYPLAEEPVRRRQQLSGCITETAARIARDLPSRRGWFSGCSAP